LNSRTIRLETEEDYELKRSELYSDFYRKVGIRPEINFTNNEEDWKSKMSIVRKELRLR